MVPHAAHEHMSPFLFKRAMPLCQIRNIKSVYATLSNISRLRKTKTTRSVPKYIHTIVFETTAPGSVLRLFLGFHLFLTPYFFITCGGFLVAFWWFLFFPDLLAHAR